MADKGGWRAGVQFSRLYTKKPGYAVGIEFDGGDSPDPGDARTLYPLGFLSLQFGEHGAWLPQQFIGPAGLQPQGVPAPSIRNTSLGISAVGLAPGPIGSASVHLWVRYVGLPGRGIAPGGYGTPAAFNRDAYAYPAGIASFASGSHRAELSRRFLLASGVAPPALGGPTASLADRRINPVGISADFPSAHMVGGTRFVRPVGFVATAFGTRIIPEIQRVYPFSFSGSYGDANVRNDWHLIVPPGFNSGWTQPEDRWGVQLVWNSRQFIAQVAEDGGDLAPPPWPQWTLIENRNKTTLTHGADSLRAGYPSIENAARVLTQKGIEAPSVSALTMIAAGERFIAPLGIDAPYMGGWLYVLNGARVVATAGARAELHGTHEIVNTRRTFKMNGFEAREPGYPWVSFGIRSIEIGGFYVIAPPVIAGPEVKLRERHIEHAGYDAARFGSLSASIHRNIVTPRWTHTERAGEPSIKNLTPEVATKGRAADEHGNAGVRLQWRLITTHETFTQIIPKPVIAFRDRLMPLTGISSMVFSDKLTVTKTGAPPYTEQVISLRGSVNPLTGAEGDGKGIGVDPNLQVPEPAMNQSVLYAESEDPSTLWGMARVTSNVIRIEFSYHNLAAVASPRVEARIRYIELTHPKDEYAIEAPYENEATPLHRMSPFTIYAMTEAPEQAMQNHPNTTGRPLHVIDGLRTGGADIQWGNARVNNQHRAWPLQGIPWVHTLPSNDMPSPKVQNRRTVVAPAGVNSLRMGRTMVPGTVELTFYLPFLATLFGTATAAFGPPRGTQTQAAGGYSFTAVGAARVEHKDRAVQVAGFLAERMGTRLVGDKPYMWQGLRVGPLMPTIPAGYRADIYGTAFVSYRVREARIQGFDGLVIGYDINDFAARMRVTRREIEKYPSRRIVTQGHSSARFGYHDARVLRQYIRPDGNSDQHRKGAF